MFHLTLVLIPLIAMAIIVSILVFAITLIIMSLIGGTSAGMLVKHKTVRTLCFLGCSILLLIGILCLSPIIALYMDFFAEMLIMVGVSILTVISILAAIGIKTSSAVNGDIPRRVLKIIFGFVCVIAAILAIFILVIT